MRIIIIFLVASVLYSLNLQSAERTVTLWGHVKDAFTNGGIRDVKITLMTTDSAVIDTQTVKYFDEDKSYMDSYYKFDVPAVQRKYIIKAEHPNYETCYVNFQIKYIARNEYFDAPYHYMKNKVHKEFKLDEVNVVATKIKFVFRKDTVVYNADAFNLPSGSMLDELVRQLPGVTLTKDGEIYMNGKKIDNLLVQGSDFVKGNNQIALQNLPSYTVKNLKFYDRNTDKNKYLGYDIDKKEFVMDVTLKKECAQGYIMNAEVGYGTHDRYMGRLFGLRFTPHSRFSIYSNINNINEYLRPGSDGEWHVSNINNGILKSKNVGLSWVASNQDENVRNALTADFQWRSGDDSFQTVKTSFLPQGDNFIISSNKQLSNGLFAFATNNFTINKPLYLSATTGWQYMKTDGTSALYSATYAQTPFDSEKYSKDIINQLSKPDTSTTDHLLVNNQVKKFQGNGYRYNLFQDISTSKKFPWGDNVDITIGGTYVKANNSSFSDYQINYLLQHNNELQKQYSAEPSNEYSYFANVNYNIHFLSNWNYALSYKYAQSYKHEVHDLYRLDRLDGWNNTNHEIGSLPSNRDSLLVAFDINNSYRSWYHKNSHNADLHIFFDLDKENGKKRFDMEFPLIRSIEKLHYKKVSLDTIAHANNWLFNPRLSYTYDNKKGMGYNIGYKMEINTPELLKTINVIDTSNPLLILLGNSKLHKTTTHNMSASYRNRIPNIQGLYNFSVEYNIYNNLIANSVTYNKETGLYTYKPQNINGNWMSKIQNGLSMALDSGRIWNLENNIDLTFNRNVDFITLSGEEKYQTSKVNNFYINDGIKLTYQKDKLRASLLGNLEWHRSVSLSKFFEPINVYDFNYGASLIYTLPWEINLSTDLRMYSRRGYNNNEANMNYLIWNGSLAKSFIHDKLNVRLIGYDILQNLSNHSYEVDGQGRTETYYNSIPSYIMLSLEWKLNINPKNKDK